MPYSRLSTGSPSCRLASTVSRPSLLQLVGAQLVADADAPTLVAPQVDEHAAALGGDAGHGVVELHPAVAAVGAEQVAGQALRVHPDQHGLLAPHVTVDHRHVLGAVELRAEGDALEVAPLGRDAGLAHPLDQLLVAVPVADEVGDGDQHQAVLAGEARPGWGRRAMVPSSLTISQITADGRQPGQLAEVHAGLGVAGPLEHAALPGPEGEDVARTGEVGGGRWPSSASARTVAARSAAEMPVVVPRSEVDADRERRAHRLGVLLDHERQVERGRPARW